MRPPSGVKMIYPGLADCYIEPMKVRHVDHIGINVEDLEAAKDFFVYLGFKVVGEMEMQGELVDRVTGLKDVKDNLVMLQAPDGQLNLELVKYHHPIDEAGVQPSQANTLGLRHLCFEVDNLDDVLADLHQKGHELVGEMEMQGELVDRVTGLKDVKDNLVMLQAPDGQLKLELVKYHQPVDAAGVQPSQANTLGLRHLCFQVEDLGDILDGLRQKGHELIGEVQTYENTYKLCYVRGPEGIIIELAESLRK